MIAVTINGHRHDLDVPDDMPMLWVLRDVLGITGPKFGCGIGQCWGCTVLVDGKPRPSCGLPAKAAAGTTIVTIEGIPEDHPVKAAWREAQVPQCGYCQPGQILRAVALLDETPRPSEADIAKAMRRHICRCGTYQRIKAAILLAASIKAGERPAPPPWPTPAEADTPAETFALNPFVSVATDGTVTVLSKHLETGQGVLTGLATLVAEELGADWGQIRAAHAPADERVYNNLVFGPMQGTGGSTAIANSYTQYRQAGAGARAMLLAAAADHLDAPAGELRVEKGVIRHEASGRQATFGELAARAATVAPPADPPLTPASAFTLIGTSPPRLDIAEKVSGAARFALDVRLPGMKTAVVARPPRFGGKVASFDKAPALAVSGVTDVVEIPSGVAVVAENTWAALEGRRALTVQWDDAGAETRGTADLRREYLALLDTPGGAVRRDGDVEAALSGAATRLSAVYEAPFLAHAPLEPLNCVARFTENGLEIYAGDQFQTVDQENAAQAAGLADKRTVTIHTLYSGGSFGRRANPGSDYIVEAVHVAKALGKKVPIHLVWDRGDDLRGGRYRPMMLHKVEAGLDTDGRLAAWQHRIAGQSINVNTPFEGALIKDGVDVTSVEGVSDMAYAIPNLAVELHTTTAKVPVLWWRSVGHSHTAFAVESFVDEAAHAAGRDPLDYRRELLAGDPRRLAVLDAAAKAAGWGAPLPDGHGRGLAVHRSFDTYVAHVAEVAAQKDGTFAVTRVTCAVDCGVVVNPDIVAAQMEGGIALGLSAVLEEALVLENGGAVPENFNRYPILRFDRMPTVDVVILPSDAPPTGVGEPGVPPLAPAVANALFAATGRRLRRLPLLGEQPSDARSGG
ncbi:Isoquinoline 1-oxidoreductase [Solidesulfovibrio carbinoliphilus subsp. oakridgensis]|uniref:Isoquinoline 1-oxidoreductase n=1 Tax=Solidesulfovibrio carbinoliphilus subsp. oakridgensis TaxID=694327 RepID=G7QBG0_9BACT|nr:molybdopterin-dependent oxidoreductase [Solidesulfovibrio carbinoliphilus]EHJ49383.1 Isoquinoline 1-oxidoreductase [Solidesulfovibrio carbinoliphilus subsp. oakridgensis]